ncbi:hypothetical protein LR002_01410, partial [Candidatus Gracilibacteria bacterium]|nr:hypothetical protein [Candidatus Gracilibacteria bacterium]
MNKKKDFITDFLQNGIIAVCENFEEAEYSRQNGASGILLVKERGGDKNDVFVMPNEDLIRNVIENIDIPILIRIKFGHFGEAKICEELGVDGLLEAFQTENSLEKKLDEKEFNLPIISEIFDVEKIPDANKNILI